MRRLTANLSGGIIEMAAGTTPSICSFTKADIAMSGRPAGGRGVANVSIRKLLFVRSIILLTQKVELSPPIPARTPTSMKTSAPHELIGPKARLWLSKPTRTSSCCSEQESFNWPSQSAALLPPPEGDRARVERGRLWLSKSFRRERLICLQKL